MKKITKILLSCLFGVSLITGVACEGTKDLEGSMQSTVNESWHKTDVFIRLGETWHSTCKSGNKDDHIANIQFLANGINEGVTIKYALSFSSADDLETYFVFDNGYKTEIEKSHFAVGGDYIYINKEISNTNNLRSAAISEVWVRTLD